MPEILFTLNPQVLVAQALRLFDFLLLGTRGLDSLEEEIGCSGFRLKFFVKLVVEVFYCLVSAQC